MDPDYGTRTSRWRSGTGEPMVKQRRSEARDRLEAGQTESAGYQAPEERQKRTTGAGGISRVAVCG